MAEKRMISKVISISKKVNLRLNSHFARLLYTWMIPHTDDFGRMAGCPHKVKALVIPMLDETWQEVESTLSELHEGKLIEWYEVDGEKYIEIINFDEHQTGLHKRTKSKFPDVPIDSRRFPEIHGSRVRAELELNRTEGNRTERNGTADTVDHKDVILKWIQKYKLECKGISQLEDISAYYGVVEIGVIEHCIKKSENQNVPYAMSILDRLIREKKTTVESLLPQKTNHGPPYQPNESEALNAMRLSSERKEHVPRNHEPDKILEVS